LPQGEEPGSAPCSPEEERDPCGRIFETPETASRAIGWGPVMENLLVVAKHPRRNNRIKVFRGHKPEAPAKRRRILRWRFRLVWGQEMLFVQVILARTLSEYQVIAK
jgi:hypothetical protein